MAKVIMKGAEVAAAMKEKLAAEVEAMKAQGIEPTMDIVRVGAKPEDLAYERGARKRLEGIGIKLVVTELPEDITQADFEAEFRKVNEDPEINGIMLFRPLPKHLNEEPIDAMIDPGKDMDCMSPVNIAKVFSGDETGFAPCTPEGVMEMLDHYGIDLKGKRVTIVGRSMVVGKPLSMLMLKKHATITICHTRTADLAGTCRGAEIVVAAAGKANMITADMVSDGAIVADVGINVGADGKMCGDVAFDEVEPKASYISPVPGGCGSVTSSVLAKHVVIAAKRQHGIE